MANHTLVVCSCVIDNTAGDLPCQHVEEMYQQKKKHSLLTPLREFEKRKLPYPICVVPPVIPVDKYDDAKLIGCSIHTADCKHISLVYVGCTIREPSIDMQSSGQEALWAIQDFKKGDTIGAQGYWGAFATRKPKHDVRTVELSFDVKVCIGRQKTERVKTLLLVGDVRCALTYINDPTRGVARRQKKKANCKIMCADDIDMMRRGIL